MEVGMWKIFLEAGSAKSEMGKSIAAGSPLF